MLSIEELCRPKHQIFPPAGREIEIGDGQIPVSRVIVLEDADHLGHIRQAYLRRMMETVGNASRFILVARAPSRIIDALRSRNSNDKNTFYI
jgi:DNA polymerase III delta prime subunit